MIRRLALLTSALLLLAFAAPPSLTVSVVQHAEHAQLIIGSFDVPPTTLSVSLPSGWSGAPATVVVSGTALIAFDLVRGSGAPQVGVVVVKGTGLEGHAYLQGAVIASAPPKRAGRVLLPIVRH
jgi:hypothetical protein